MKPLKTTRQVLTWFFVYDGLNSSRAQKLLYMTIVFITFAIIACHLAASAAFILEFVSMDLESSLYAMYQITAWTPALYMIIVALATRAKITALFSGLEDLYCASKLIFCIHFSGTYDTK